MDSQEKREMFQFLAVHWHSRPENDEEIVKEVVEEMDPYDLTEIVTLLRRYLAGPESIEDKSTFIRKSVQRYIPDTTSDAAIHWLEGIICRLEE